MSDQELSLDDIFSRLKKEGEELKKETKVPFKFLDSYTRDDDSIFFGRDNETEEIFRKLYSGKLLLVYGKSGTGKSSIINCGLISKIPQEDIYSINIRCGRNAYSNFISEINKYSGNRQDDPLEILEDIFYRYSKPVALIFDQFEEVFILSSEDERKKLAEGLNEILLSRLKINIILIIREEYFASLTEFESVIPGLYGNRVRIERMNRYSAKEAIVKPCLACDVGIEEGLADKIIDQLAWQSEGLELTWLQILMDRLYRRAAERDPENPVISNGDLVSLGRIGNVLSDFLDEQLKQMPESDHGEAVLKTMISTDGTKKLVNLDEISAALMTTGYLAEQNAIEKILMHFVNVRIITDRNEDGYYELRHDALAGRIYERMTATEKELIEARAFLENSLRIFKQRNVLLTDKDLKYIARFETNLILSDALKEFIEISRKELRKTRQRIRTLSFAAVITLIVVLSGLTIWALNEKHKSNLNFLKARAVSYNFLSQKVVETNPTTALYLAEYAFKIDSTNPDISENVRRIYYDNNTYKILSRLKDDCVSPAFSPDGKMILAALANGEIYLFDLQGNVIKSFKGHNDIIYDATFSPDGKCFLTASGRDITSRTAPNIDNTARLWDLEGNALQVFKGHTDGVMSVAFSPDGKSILTGSADSTACLWDMKGNIIQIFKRHKETVSTVAFSPDGKNILTGSGDGTTFLWDLHGNVRQIYKGHKGAISSIVLSPDGKKILTGSWDYTARLWDLKGKVLQVYKGHSGPVRSRFSRDGKVVITFSADGTARAWDLNGKVLQVFKGCENPIFNGALSSDGKILVTSSHDKTLRLWKLQGNLLQVFTGSGYPVIDVKFSPDGKSVLTSACDWIGRLWDLDGNLVQALGEKEKNFGYLTFSPDGKYILTSINKTVFLYDLHGNLINKFNIDEDQTYSVAFSPNGKNIILGGSSNIFFLRDLQGNVIQVFKGHKGYISNVAFSPDGHKILTASVDSTVRLWDLNGNILKIFKGHEGGVNTAIFSPDAKYVLSCSQDDHTARLWDLEGSVLQVIKPAGQAAIAFSPDGQRILAGVDSVAFLWDLKGNVLQMNKGHTNQIWAVAFSPDGKSFLTGSFDGKACLWNVKKSLDEYQKSSDHQELSLDQKLKYGILGVNDILEAGDEKTMDEAAEYYLNEIKSTSKEKRLENINNAMVLYDRLASRYRKKAYSSMMDSLKIMKQH